MIVTPRNFRCGQCGAESNHYWARINYLFGVADLDQRSRDVHSPLEVSVQRCPTCGLCARRIDQAKDEFARVAMRSAEYAALLDRNDLPRLAQTYLLASCVERTRGFAGRAAWFALSAAWVCDDASNVRGAMDAREIAVMRLFEARERSIHVTQSIFSVPPRGTTQLVLVDTFRKLGRWMDAGVSLFGMPQLGREDPPWILNAVAFEAHLIKAQDSSNYRQKDADAWCTRQLFARIPPPQMRANDKPASAAPKPPSGVRPVFFWSEHDRRPWDPRDPIGARYGMDSDAVEHIDTARRECTLADAINAMFPAMHQQWSLEKWGLRVERKFDLLPRFRDQDDFIFPPRIRFEDTEYGAEHARRRRLRAERAERRKAFAAGALQKKSTKAA